MQLVTAEALVAAAFADPAAAVPRRAPPAWTPPGPFRIDDTTPVEARLAWLERLIAEARSGGPSGAAVAALARLAWAEAVRADGGSPAARARAALRFAQRAGYRADPAHQEWFAPLAWTVAYGGDCDKLASLFVAIARRLGLRARLVWIDVEGHDYNHVTAQVRLAGAWRWAEASVCGARVGESPLAAARRLDAWYIFRPGAGYVACPPPPGARG